jgi:23S rRNA (cytidine2498-2'-O)-methyltransferase
LDVTFARQGFRIHSEVSARGSEFEQLLLAELRTLAGDRASYTLLVWAPDHTETHHLHSLSAKLEQRLRSCLKPGVDPEQTVDSGRSVIQVALDSTEHAYIGSLASEQVWSLASGGRARMRVGADRPSRAARKLEEALGWFGIAPGPTETCADLGAAPGGWTWCLLRRRARVIAVDPANLAPDLVQQRGLVHLRTSAFQFVPEEPLDWLFCDLAWRPLEVAQLLAKWGRRRWARFLIANLKLPMKKKAAMVEQCRGIVAAGGWRQVRCRQLYHDRDEVTLTAHAV